MGFGSSAEFYDGVNGGAYLPYADFLVGECFSRADIPVREVLDLGCGTGEMCRILAGRGYDMIGVDDSADIGSICVAEPFRRRHIADVMLGGIIELLLKKKIVKVWLEVRESNAAARALYSAHGFREAGTVRSYYRAPTENAVRMALDLGENEDTLV